jgi:uncharacterized protein YqeY
LNIHNHITKVRAAAMAYNDAKQTKRVRALDASFDVTDIPKNTPVNQDELKQYLLDQIDEFN